MYKSTITVKGQTTIPLDIRKKLNLSAGDNIEYYTNDNNTVTIFNSNLDIHNLCGILPKPSKIITIEEMKEVINNRVLYNTCRNTHGWYLRELLQ